MDPSEGNAEEEVEICSPCSSDKENSTSSESPMVLKDLPKSQNLDVNDYETMEELDFEEDRRDTDLQKYVNVLQTSVQQNIISDSQNELSPRKNGESNSQTELRNKSFENSDPGKENCEASDIEEGETVDDGDCVEVEDGEIDDMSKTEDLQKFSCRFFRQGRCIWGKDCRYLHLSDKGLYNMFDSPSKPKKLPLQTIAAFVNEPKFVYQPPPPQLPPVPIPVPVLEKSPDRGWVEKSSESVWDKALHEAKERIKQSKMRKDDDTFKSTMHVQVEKNDRLIGKSKSGFSRDKPLSPVPMNERVVCSFSNRYNANKFEKSKNFSSVKSNMNRNTSERKIGFDSEWSDPWRRSKTPLKRKRCPSKSFSDSSSVSSDISRTSWERDSKDKSPSPKRSKNQRTLSRNSRSRSFGHKDSPTRSWRASSGSHKGSSSSRSRSSSPKFSSNVNRYQTRKKNVRSPITSPAYRKRKNHRSPDSIVLPYKRVDRSVSPPRKVFTKVDSIVKREPLPLPRQKPIRRSRSRSRSSSKSVVRRMSAESSGSQSCSDVSVSTISDSSLSKKSSFSDTDFTSNKYNVRNTDVPKMKSERSVVKVAGQRLIDILPRARRSRSAEKPAKKEIANSVPAAKIQTQAKAKPKRALGLEMELLKYQHQIRGPKPKPTQISQISPIKTEPKSPPPASTVTGTKNSKNDEADVNSEKRSKGIVNNNQTVLSDRTLSKRDLLMQQLKAVEEAIARKKKTVYAT